MSNNAHELSNRLLNALDNNYNVVDMHTVNEIISVLERINITKELLETTRLGKHVNELRRKTTDPTLARRAKVLVKRWRDLVIPTVASPGHAGSNRSSAERQVRRLGGTPLTSPALSRQVVSPAVLSPRPPSRPAWGGYESDSQDVILVDDEPPPPPPPPNPLANTHKPLTPPVKRPPSPEPLYDEKKAKRDKKPKKRRGHSRAGTGAETLAAPAPGVAPPAGPGAGAAGAGALPAPAPAAPWGTRNGASHERRRNGTRQPVDSYAALVHRMPPAGAKKVKTTKELLEQIQSRGSRPATSPGSPRSPRSPASPDVMLIEPDAPAPVKVESPLRNGAASPRAESPESTCAPLEDEREYCECTCGAEAASACPAAARAPARPGALLALHHAYVPGVNGTRAPLHPHRFAVRPLRDPARPELFASVVPLYKYSDYADDYCAKNMARVPLCEHLPWTSFAPPPPEPPPPPSPPPPRPYPPDDGAEPDDEAAPSPSPASPAPAPAPSEVEPAGAVLAHSLSPPPHRTVERTKAPDDAALDGAALVAAARAAVDAVPYDYAQLAPAPVLSLAALSSDDAIVEALLAPAPTPDRPGRPERFAEWHECATLGRLVALPYVVID